jgi:hypothetical protein
VADNVKRLVAEHTVLADVFTPAIEEKEPLTAMIRATRRKPIIVKTIDSIIFGPDR